MVPRAALCTTPVNLEGKQREIESRGAGLEFAKMSSQEIVVFRNDFYFKSSYIDNKVRTISFNYRFSSFYFW